MRNLRRKRRYASTRVKTQLEIFKEKYLNKERLVLYGFALLVLLLLSPFLNYFLVCSGISNSILENSNEIPQEFEDGIIFLLNNSEEDFQKKLDLAIDLYEQNVLRKLYIFTNENQKDVITEIQDLFESEDLTVDFYGDNYFDICSEAKNVYNLDKALIIDGEEDLVRSLYSCGFSNLFVKGLVVDGVDSDSVWLEQVMNIFKDTLKINFGINL